MGTILSFLYGTPKHTPIQLITQNYPDIFENEDEIVFTEILEKDAPEYTKEFKEFIKSDCFYNYTDTNCFEEKNELVDAFLQDDRYISQVADAVNKHYYTILNFILAGNAIYKLEIEYRIFYDEETPPTIENTYTNNLFIDQNNAQLETIVKKFIKEKQPVIIGINLQICSYELQNTETIEGTAYTKKTQKAL